LCDFLFVVFSQQATSQPSQPSHAGIWLGASMKLPAASRLEPTEATSLVAHPLTAASTGEAPSQYSHNARILCDAFDAKQNLRQLVFRSTVQRSGASFAPLDGLRGLSFLWVFAFHFRFQSWCAHMLQDIVFLDKLVLSGAIAVTLFLVLSGFLLAHIMLTLLRRAGNVADGSNDGIGWFCSCYVTFIWRRFARVYPSLVMCTLAIWTLSSSMAGDGWSTACNATAEALPGPFSFIGIKAGGLWLPMLRNALLVDNLDGKCGCGGEPGLCAPWTVSLEFQCYLVLPPLVWLYWRSRPDGIRAAVAVVIGTVTLRCAHELLHMPFFTMPNFGDMRNPYRQLQFHVAEYTCGILSYFCFDSVSSHANAPQATRALRLAAVLWYAGWLTWGVISFRHTADDSPPLDWLSKPAFSASAAALIFVACITERLESLSHVALVQSGTHATAVAVLPMRLLNRLLASHMVYPLASLSYTGYLTQAIVLNAASRLHYAPMGFGTEDWGSASISLRAKIRFLFMLGTLLLIAALFSLAVERPMLKLLQRFRPAGCPCCPSRHA
jgi:peptidoglycan/LPS O-acetylase OafA/YrhL